MPHTMVVGAGILGASIAFHLARAGARVTVVARDAPGGRATPASFAWINASWGNDPTYYELRMESIRRWRRLEQELPGLGLSWGGSLTYDVPEDVLDRYVAEFSARGYPLRPVSQREIRSLEPRLMSPPERAVLAEAEGAVEPVQATIELLRASGAVMVRSNVQGIDLAGDRVHSVMTDEGSLEADEVVVAVGAAAPELLATVGRRLELDAPPGLLVHTKPLPRLIAHLIIAPEVHLRQTRDCRLVAGSDFGGSPIDRGPMVVAQELLDLVHGMVAGAEGAEFERYSVGYRPTPVDGLPIAGRVAGIEGLYVAVMHSGITNAPAIGAFVAEEILNGKRHPLLNPYGLDRFG